MSIEDPAPWREERLAIILGTGGDGLAAETIASTVTTPSVFPWLTGGLLNGGVMLAWWPSGSCALR